MPTECACGHVDDEHGHDPKYPGSSACNIDGCDCVCFDDAEETGSDLD